jgi:hypothetical protein
MYRNFGKNIRREIGLKIHEIVHKASLIISGNTRVLIKINNDHRQFILDMENKLG